MQNFFLLFTMCLNLYDYQSKVSRFRKVSILKKQNNHKLETSIDSQKPKRRGIRIK